MKTTVGPGSSPLGEHGVVSHLQELYLVFVLAQVKWSAPLDAQRSGPGGACWMAPAGSAAGTSLR